ncbi:MAG TPA: DHA2 family efflux MFS transporter permease subunit [bacterium]|nr:DHA2 family efflux MFS transporter permease subunit [bacterium]
MNPLDEHGYPADGYKWSALVTVMVGLFMAVLDSNIVNVALSHMMSTFSTNTDRIRWVVESYAISYAIFTLCTGWLREKIGIKYTYITGLVIFTVASGLCGMAWSVEAMIAFRVLQGLGGGLMMPTGFTLITESFPPKERGAAYGIFGLVIVFAPSVGPTLGGYLVDHVNWRFVFSINIPVGILNFFMAMGILKEFKKLAPRPFDFFGFAGLAMFLGCLLTAFTEGQREGWTSDYILSMFAISAIGLVSFISFATRAKYPILNINLFKNFYFNMLSILNVLRSVAIFGRVFLLPLFFQNLLGYSAMTSGLLLSPGALIAGAIMPVAGKLVDKYGPKYFLIVGFVLFALSNLLYFNLDVATPYTTILIPMFFYGVGAGLLNAPITASSMNVVRRDQIGDVSVVLSVLMQVGGAFGVALLGTLTNSRAAFHQAVYAEKVTTFGLNTQSALDSIGNLGRRIGESQFLYTQQAPVILNSQISKWVAIRGYQDAFVITGLICLIALIPTFALMKMKFHHMQ